MMKPGSSLVSTTFLICWQNIPSEEFFFCDLFLTFVFLLSRSLIKPLCSLVALHTVLEVAFGILLYATDAEQYPTIFLAWVFSSQCLKTQVPSSLLCSWHRFHVVFLPYNSYLCLFSLNSCLPSMLALSYC